MASDRRPRPEPARPATLASSPLGSRWCLAAVLALAVALRVAHVLALRATPWFEHLVVDPEFYDEWARRIAAGDWMGERVFYMDLAGEWVLTTAQAGQNFYTGNNPLNPYGAYGALPFVRGNPHFEEEDFRAAAEARVGRRLTPREVSRFWFGEAFRHMREHPARSPQNHHLVVRCSRHDYPDGLLDGALD